MISNRALDIRSHCPVSYVDVFAVGVLHNCCLMQCDAALADRKDVSGDDAVSSMRSDDALADRNDISGDDAFVRLLRVLQVCGQV